LISSATHEQLLASWTPSHSPRLLYSVCLSQQRSHGATGGVQDDDAVTISARYEQLVGIHGDDAPRVFYHGTGKGLFDAQIAIHLDYCTGSKIGDEYIPTVQHGYV